MELKVALSMQVSRLNTQGSNWTIMELKEMTNKEPEWTVEVLIEP